jgi:hypothetical protein
VDETISPGRGEEPLLNQFLARYDAPAYVRRARQVQDAFDTLTACCRRQRQQWLAMVCLRLANLRALAGQWTTLRPWLANDDQLDVLAQLHADLAPRLRAPVETTSSARILRRGLHELHDSIERFNGRWLEYLANADLTPINALREGYNRYFLLEKECAVRSARLARQGFSRLEPLTLNELTALLPPLPVLVLNG